MTTSFLICFFNLFKIYVIRRKFSIPWKKNGVRRKFRPYIFLGHDKGHLWSILDHEIASCRAAMSMQATQNNELLFSNSVWGTRPAMRFEGRLRGWMSWDWRRRCWRVKSRMSIIKIRYRFRSFEGVSQIRRSHARKELKLWLLDRGGADLRK